jgi:hypothetical protein
MAVVIDVVAPVAGFNAALYTLAHTVIPGTNLLVVCIANSGGIGPNSVTFNAQPLTKKLDAFDGTDCRNTFWYLLNPPAIAANIVATMSASGFGVMGAINVSGVGLARPFHASGSKYGNAVSTSVTIPSATGEVVLDSIAVRPTSPSPGIGQTLIYAAGSGGGGVVGDTSYKAGASNVTMSWDWSWDSAKNYILSAIALMPPISNPMAPTGVFAIQRLNYAIVHWNQVLQDDTGTLIGDVDQYEVWGSSLLNESDMVLKGIVSTKDANGMVDTIFIDSNPSPVMVYRVVAVVGTAPNELKSVLSDRTVAEYSSSQIDGKTERIDSLLLIWDNGNWDENFWS